jgi:adenylate kinase
MIVSMITGTRSSIDHTIVQNIVVPDEHVVAKLLGRSGCDDCGKSYNVADVHDDANSVYMPAILPAAAGEFHNRAADDNFDVSLLQCDCGGRLSSRSDDTAEVIERRLALFHAETAPLVDYYRKEGLLTSYHVRYGTGDMEQLEQDLRTLLSQHSDSE